MSEEQIRSRVRQGMRQIFDSSKDQLGLHNVHPQHVVRLVEEHHESLVGKLRAKGLSQDQAHAIANRWTQIVNEQIQYDGNKLNTIGKTELAKQLQAIEDHLVAMHLNLKEEQVTPLDEKIQAEREKSEELQRKIEDTRGKNQGDRT